MIPSVSEQFESIAFCPISKTLMETPVTTPHGTTFDKSALLKYLRENDNKTPYGELINPDTVNTTLQTNPYVKKLIQDYKAILSPTHADIARLVTQYRTARIDEQKLIAALWDFSIEVASCPITGMLMDEPVITPDGHCYEKRALEEYLATHDNKTPEGILIADDPQERQTHIVLNKTLQRETRNLIQGCEKGLHPSAQLAHYLDFFQRIAIDKIHMTGTYDSPAVLSVNPDRDGHVSAGITSITNWSHEIATRQAYQTDPSDHSNLTIDNNRKYQLFAYIRLHDALLKLSAALKAIALDNIAIDEMSEELKQHEKFKPYDYVYQNQLDTTVEKSAREKAFNLLIYICKSPAYIIGAICFIALHPFIHTWKLIREQSHPERFYNPRKYQLNKIKEIADTRLFFYSQFYLPLLAVQIALFCLTPLGIAFLISGIVQVFAIGLSIQSALIYNKEISKQAVIPREKSALTTQPYLLMRPMREETQAQNPETLPSQDTGAGMGLNLPLLAR